MCLQYKSFENTVGKQEIARNKQFLLCPQCFLHVWRTFCHFHKIWYCHLQTLLVWKSLKFVVWHTWMITWEKLHIKTHFSQVNFKEQGNLSKSDQFWLIVFDNFFDWIEIYEGKREYFDYQNFLTSRFSRAFYRNVMLEKTTKILENIFCTPTFY